MARINLTLLVFKQFSGNFLSKPSLLLCTNLIWKLTFSQTFLSGPVCWKNQKKSYGRDIGTIPLLRCPSHRPDKHASLCYKRCRSGYKNFGCCICYKGWSTYGRGVGIAQEQYCRSSSLTLHHGYCYKKCRTNYYGVS